MKRKLLVFICVCLLMSGCSKRDGALESGPAAAPAPSEAAATLAPTNIGALNLSAAEALRATWLSNTGKTVISVDAAVDIPDADVFPIIEVGRRLASEDEVRGMINAAFPDGSHTGDEGYVKTDEKKGENSFFDNTRYLWRAQHAKGSVTAIASVYGGILTSSKIEYCSPRTGTNYVQFVSPLRDLRGEGNPYSPEEAQTIADEIIHATSVDLRLAASGVYLIHHEEAAYVFIYARAPGGIPITYTTTQTGYSSEAEFSEQIQNQSYNTSYFYETAYAIVNKDGLYYACYESPYEMLGVLREDCARMSLEEAARVAESVLPLKYASLERDYDQVSISIDRVTLGYTRVQMRNEPDRFILVPAWDFFGEYSLIRDGVALVTHDGAYQSLLTLNATDGTVIDRGYGY